MGKMRIYPLKEAPIKKGTRVIVRAGLDVPLQGKKIIDATRIHENISTLRFILKKGGSLRIITKIGRPKGTYIESLSVRPVARYLERLLNKRVVVISDPTDKKRLEKYSRSSEVILFENIYFWPEEKDNSHKFAIDLADWGDIYVNEAFASSHRRDTSIVALAKLLPSFAGLRFEKEISNLEVILQKPKRPFIVMLGGIKLETKLPLIKHFIKEADSVLLAGGIANSVFRARGFETGRSTTDVLPDKKLVESKKLRLPLDVVAVKSVPSRLFRIISPDRIKKDEHIVDIGPRTAKEFSLLVRKANTVVWNGPLGLTPYFPKGTREFAKNLVKSKAFRVVGGGDTVAALREFGISLNSFNHVSTGGGAMLEMLAGKKLPGTEALKR